MNLVYVLVPFFKIDSPTLIQNTAEELLGFQPQSGSINIHQLSSKEFALEIHNFSLHFIQINHLLQEYTHLNNKINLLESVLSNYEYNRTDQNLSDVKFNNDNYENNEIMLKKLKKYNQIKEENKKLKKLLQVQLENTQKVREETQKTMKVLRQQFDALVQQISNKGKNPIHSNPTEPENKHINAIQKINAKLKHPNPR